MKEQRELFDKTERAMTVKGQYVDDMINFLLSLTPDKLLGSVGVACGYKNGSCISLMRQGTLLLHRKHLDNFASTFGKSSDDLIAQFWKYYEMPNKLQFEWKLSESTGVIIPKEYRERFLIGLQAATGHMDGMTFNNVLNDKQIRTEMTNILFFHESGFVPQHWWDAISDPQKRDALIDHYTRPSTPLSQQHLASVIATPKSKPKPVNDPEPKANGLSSDEPPPQPTQPDENVCICTCLSELPPHLCKAAIPALVAAGKAIRIKEPLSLFVGKLATGLPSYAISCKPVEDHSSLVVITIKNLTTEVRIFLDPLQLFV